MSTETYTTEAAHVGRCASCKRGVRVTVASEVTLGAFNGRPTSRSRILTGGVREHNGHTLVSCCGASVVVKPIRGTVTEKKCGTRCTSAVGPSCDCECGGERHAQDHNH
jgi:hypothetical protein